MASPTLAFASVKSFGDFVIARSVLHRVADHDKHRVRMIACSHVEGLNAILADDVRIAFVDAGREVPAIFDLKKRGVFAAVQSALSLRREFQRIERDPNEALAFDTLGVRERFIAGHWPVITTRNKGWNIYETYLQFLADQQIQASAAPLPQRTAGVQSVGIFPESRLIEKRLDDAAIALIYERAALAGLAAKLFILEGDLALQRKFPSVVRIPRNFDRLADALKSVDAVISADSLPGHLGEYFARPVFVACPAPNEYWLPHRCFTTRHWGIFREHKDFAVSLDRFFAANGAAHPKEPELRSLTREGNSSLAPHLAGIPQ